MILFCCSFHQELHSPISPNNFICTFSSLFSNSSFFATTGLILTMRLTGNYQNCKARFIWKTIGFDICTWVWRFISLQNWPFFWFASVNKILFHPSNRYDFFHQCLTKTFMCRGLVESKNFCFGPSSIFS